MGILNNLLGRLLRGEAPSQPQSARSPPATSNAGIVVTFTSSAEPAVSISESEMVEALAHYQFIHGNELPLVKPPQQWFDESTQQRRLRDGSEKAYAWLTPFLPLSVAKLPPLLPYHERGPNAGVTVVKVVRGLVRDARKQRQPVDELMHSLYGAAVMADMAGLLEFEGMPIHTMAKYVDIAELQDLRIDYQQLGYANSASLSVTDRKWLVETFGEPAVHRSVEDIWPAPSRNAISRYCWNELRTSNKACQSLGLPQNSMDEWLRELVKRNLGYHKEWLQRVTVQKEHLAAKDASIAEAWAAMDRPFAVADLETTGLQCERDEILELALVLVEPGGKITGEFSALVRTQRPVPAEITRLTGITEQEVDRLGQPLMPALKAFLSHLGDRPVFFHNSPFDEGFLRKATTQNGISFSNAIYDSLPLARIVWPSRDSYKLAVLAQELGIAAPSHRALRDAHVTLCVLNTAKLHMSSR